MEKNVLIRVWMEESLLLPPQTTSEYCYCNMHAYIDDSIKRERALLAREIPMEGTTAGFIRERAYKQTSRYISRERDMDRSCF